jgi:hypothetical protein
LAGDFFDRYEHYSSIIDSLRAERVYDRFKKMVLEPATFTEGFSCGVDPALVFPEQRVVLGESLR